jgi:hypothetical protein
MFGCNQSDNDSRETRTADESLEIGRPDSLAQSGEKPDSIVLTATQDSTPTIADTTPPPPPARRYSKARLQLKLLKKYGLNWCDDNMYPVGRTVSDEEIAGQLALYQQKDPQLYREVQRDFKVHPDSTPTLKENQMVFSRFRRARAIRLTLKDDRYHFEFFAGLPRAQKIIGSIGKTGDVEIDKKIPGGPNCPKCLAENTVISTPSGLVKVTDLFPGMSVWTMDQNGNRQSKALLRVQKVPVPESHQMLQLKLEDGRKVLVSPLHPDRFGCPLKDLHKGDLLDGSRIKGYSFRQYESGYTYDLLPAGGTGLYWANGILIGSTMNERLQSSSEITDNIDHDSK